jgi:HEAT repeat protein
MNLKFQRFASNIIIVALLTSAVAIGTARAADSTSAEKQTKFVNVLKSEAAPQEKAIACKQLSIYGSKEAVPALAALLADKELSSWARIALEAITDPAADEALRDAVEKVQGRLLVGVINSLGFRRSAVATDTLVKKLTDADAAVASAAGAALGRIGGDQAAKALEQALAGAPEGVRPSIADGCVLCAEKYLTDGKYDLAVKLYDTVRKANVPKQKKLNATRGAILARRSDGIPLLIEQLRSPDKAFLSIGLSTARELPGSAATQALIAEFEKSSPERSAMLFLALGDREDAAVMPVIVKTAKEGSNNLRILSFGMLEKQRNVASVPVLLDGVSASDADVSNAAKAALARLSGKGVDEELSARLGNATGKLRLALVELAGQRRIASALPAIAKSADDADPVVRGAAIQAMGSIGGDKQVGDLVKLLQKAANAKERGDIEKALLSVCGRSGAACVPQLQPLAKSDEAALRATALHALASVGGADALAAVTAAMEDKDEAVQDEAVRALSGWPNRWPDDAGVAGTLLKLAESGKKTSHQVLGLRGYLQYVQGDKSLKDEERVAKINALLPLIKRPEEKRLAIAAIGEIPAAGMLDLLLTFAADAEFAEDAFSAISNFASDDVKGVSKEQRLKALQTVAEKTKNTATKKRAENLMKKIK